MQDIRKSKVYKLIENLAPERSVRFKLFLKSPLFGKNDTPLAFWERIEQHLLNQSQLPLEEEQVFFDLFPMSISYSKQSLDQVKSTCIRLFYKFLSVEARLPDEYRGASSKDGQPFQIDAFSFFGNLAELSELGLVQQEVTQRLSHLRARLEGARNKDSHFHYFQFFLRELELKDATGQGRVDTMQSYAQAYENMRIFSNTQLLRLTCVMINLHRHTGTQLPKAIQQQIPHLLALNNSTDPLQNAYCECLRMLQDPTHDNWNRLRANLTTLEKDYEGDDISDLYQHLINFQIREFNKDQSSEINLQKLADVYQLVLNRNIIARKESFFALNYRNMLSVMLKAGREQQVAKFLMRHEDSPKDRNSIALIEYTKSIQHFRNSEWELALECLNKVWEEAEIILWRVDAKAMTCMALYEMRRLETLETTLNTFKTFLNRAMNGQVARKSGAIRISDEHAKAYKNFVSYLKRLIDLEGLDYRTKISRSKKITAELQDSKWVASKVWLLSKLNRIQ